MIVVNDDLSIYLTRGDAVGFNVVADIDGKPYTFKIGDVLRLKVFAKKNCENVVLQKDFGVEEDTQSVAISLTEEDTKIGGLINKPVDYWYEVELNPLTNLQTIIGYDDDGAKLFRLFPEGKDIEPIEPKPEDIPIVDASLDITSTRPVQNREIASAVATLKANISTLRVDVYKDISDTNAEAKRLRSELATERARITNLSTMAEGSTTGDAELTDIRVGADGVTYASAGEAVRATANKKADKTELNRFLHNDIFSNLAIAHEIGDVICDYKGGVWLDYYSGSFKLPVGTYTLVVPKLDISSIGGICLEYEGGVSDGKLRIVEATKVGAYQFYINEENVALPIVLRVRISNATEPEYRKYTVYSPIIVKGDTSQVSIMPDYLTNHNQLLENKVSIVRGKNLFNKDASGHTYGYYLNTNNVLTTNDAMLVTEFIAVEPNTSYVASGYKIQAAYINFYDKDRLYISGVQGYNLENNSLVTPENCYFIKWSVGVASVDVFQLEKGEIATAYEPYTNYQPVVLLDERLKKIEEATGITDIIKYPDAIKVTCETLANGKSLTATDRLDVKKNKVYVFSAKVGETVNIELSHGATVYGGSIVEITNENINGYDVTSNDGRTRSITLMEEHGLQLSEFITVIVKVGIKASVTIFTATGSYTTAEFEWWGSNGTVKAKNNGDELTDCTFSLTVGDKDKPIWVFGDSYLGLTSKARYPYYLLEMGFDNWLASGFAGAGVAPELDTLENLLKLGKPKYVVWCLGMNNGDNGKVSQSWLTATTSVISMCKENDIEVVLATIPSVPTIDNSFKNAWVKESGYRYIDFEDAVVEDGNVWYEGMLSTDGVHPSELGAKALAAKFLTDFPEITM